MHKVVFGENLSKIAKKYNVEIDEILKINPALTKDNLMPDQIIRIPNKAKPNEFKSKPKISETKQTSKGISGKKIHIVEEKETLYSISKKYNITVENLVNWNKIKPGQSIQPGMELKIAENVSDSQPKQLPDKVSEAKNTSITAVKKEIEKKEEDKISADKKNEGKSEEKLTEIKPVKVDTEKKDTLLTFENKPDIQASNNETQKELKSLFAGQNGNPTEKIRGTGAPMTTSLGQMETAYVVQHRTLPIGMVIKIKNLVNSKVVYAKVIGKLFDNQDNKNIIVRYSAGVKKDLQLQNGKNYVEIEIPE